MYICVYVCVYKAAIQRGLSKAPSDIMKFLYRGGLSHREGALYVHTYTHLGHFSYINGGC